MREDTNSERTGRAGGGKREGKTRVEGGGQSGDGKRTGRNGMLRGEERENGWIEREGQNRKNI